MKKYPYGSLKRMGQAAPKKKISSTSAAAWVTLKKEMAVKVIQKNTEAAQEKNAADKAK